VRALPCRGEDRTHQFRYPDAASVILTGLGSWGAR
jgi:hypothetical protein